MVGGRAAVDRLQHLAQWRCQILRILCRTALDQHAIAVVGVRRTALLHQAIQRVVAIGARAIVGQVALPRRS